MVETVFAVATKTPLTNQRGYQCNYHGKPCFVPDRALPRAPKQDRRENQSPLYRFHPEEEGDFCFAWAMASMKRPGMEPM